jgi:hypothetical protein
MTKRNPFPAIVVAWLLQVMASRVYADPVTIPITSGLLSYPVQNEATLRVQLPNGSAAIEWSDGLAGDWPPDFYAGCCTPGMSLNLSTDESFPDPLGTHFGQLSVGSNIYSVTSFSFSVIALRDIQVPGDIGERQHFTGIPFTFRGAVSGTTPDGRTLTLGLSGLGRASATLFALSESQSYLGGASYNFESTTPSPVPEPGTWLLVATGLGAVMRRRVGSRRE